MIPTEILSAEHRVILRVLSCLEAIVAEATAHGKLSAEPATSAIAFFRGFADQWHHAKEEKHLFSLMEQRGIPRSSGPIGVMLNEHDLGRAQVRGMDAAVESAAQGQPESLRAFVGHARLYIELLRAHIQKEDGILYPMANQVFSDQDQHDLSDAFHRAGHDEMGDGIHESFHAIADQLGTRYGIAPVLAGEDEACDACAHRCDG